MNLALYDEVKNWKKPLHRSKTALARAYIKLLSGTEVVGIAGSVGKTLTQNSVYSVLSQKHSVMVGSENLDPTFRIPHTVLKTKPWHKYLILEYGIEHPGEMDYYTNLVKPKYVVVTTITPEHTKYLKDIDGVFAEESRIVTSLSKNGYVLLNHEDDFSRKLAKVAKAPIIYYGAHAKNGLKISHFSQSLHGAKYRIHYKGEIAVVSTKVVGRHHLTSAYAAATMGVLAGLTLKQIAKGLSQVKPPQRRLNVKITEHVNIIDDTYNSSPKAAEESIKTLMDLGKGKKKIAVLGEMRDLGSLSNEAHRELGESIAKKRLNYLVTVGKVAEEIAISAKKAGFKGRVVKTKNTKEALVCLKPLTNKKTLILIKGSRHEHLERIGLGLMHKSTAIECYHCSKLK